MTARPSTQQARANRSFFTLLQQQIGKQQTRMIVPQTVESQGVYIQWNGMVEWNSGTTGMVECFIGHT